MQIMIEVNLNILHLELRKISRLFVALTLIYLNLIISKPCFSLPGDSIQKSIKHINRNQLGEGLIFKPFYINSILAHYEAIIQFQGNNVKIIVGEKVSADMQKNYSEAVFIENSSIGQSLSKKGYNLRRDQAVNELISRIWGESISQDFINSRFIDRYYENARHRTTYQGKKFGYIAYYADYGDRFFRFDIYSLKDWKTFRIPGEFEERVKY
ncbi:hypothetical protein IQ231_17840 [Cuspidothrix issatschenkoi LEGE 03284]|uniref:hypothetical protein n=1 Tax=Cuspidothrix issatschenkoi TaxID=230752 RepID=UPI00187F239E|nr:hypothetical protein [Cuspidothrix issatschenkoi]MBE9233478.1 hypothetical protein [Cuspidothrix issatschenkoi LEGE 03284]